MSLRLIALPFLLGASMAASAAEPSAASTTGDNTELRTLYEQDQSDRKGKVDWAIVAPRDLVRQKRAGEILRDGGVRTAPDYYRAAMIYQHGDTANDTRLANALATVAMTLDPGAKPYRWLAAASWDRLLMRRNQPQWYGTQYRSDDQGLYLYPVAEDAVSDEERDAMGVPSLAQARQKLTELAGVSGVKVRDPQPGMDELRTQSKLPEGK